MIQDILQLLEQRADTTIITATRRLSRRLLFEYNQQQSARGFKVWLTPRILPWSAWLQKQWESFAIRTHSSHVSLSQWQSLLLWQSIIERDTDGLINIQATARHAQSARQQVIDYRLDLDSEQALQWFVYDRDASRWLEWNHQYIRKLEKNNWLDEPALAVRMIEAIRDQEHDIPTPLCFAGFDVLTPLQERLREWLEEQSLWITSSGPTRKHTHALRHTCRDADHEIGQAAYWARQQLEESWSAGDEPIGIIVLGLEQQRDRIERIFREAFYPEDGYSITASDRFHGQGIREGSIFNISLGSPLSHEPSIAAALDILTLCRHRFEFETFSRVLRSDHIKGAAEYASERSLVDVRLRQYASAETSLKDVLASLPEACPRDFADKLQRLADLLREWKGRVSASVWVERFQRCLHIFGWPGESIWSDYRYQVQKGLDEVWFEFARTDIVLAPISLEQALSNFASQVSGQIFQLGAAELPVQILGGIESAGMSFSRLWVIGMTESNWPPPANPNPFIPLRLQRQRAMPGCSPQRQYKYASLQTRRLLQATPSIIFSYSLLEGEQQHASSPLIADFPDSDMEFPAEKKILAPAYEYLSDEQAPEVDVHHYSAGSNALKDQAACPFRAFINHRLKAAIPEEPLPGSDPRNRGRLVHEVMERLWRKWRHLGRLQAMGDEELSEQVASTAAQVLDNNRVFNREIEKQRLIHLVLEWLEQEKLRQSFEIVAVEEKVSVSVEGLKLHLYIDRIDQQPDGSYCIIDYKTGEAKANAWSGERPDEPQLPLYSIIQQQPVSTVAFANMRAGECRYVGVTQDKEQFSISHKEFKNITQLPFSKGNSIFKIYQDWDAMLSEWRKVISRLSREHIKGDAAIDPRQPPLTCRYCGIHPVCRLSDWQKGRGLKDNAGEEK